MCISVSGSDEERNGFLRNQNISVLDSAAKGIHCVTGKNRSAPVFRLTAVLKEDVDADLLRQAVRELVPRFPLLYARLQRGFIWYGLAEPSDLDIVTRDDGAPCRGFDRENGDKPLLRVLYGHHHIAAELCHLTSDGYGGLVYLTALVARYLALRGQKIEKSPFILDYRDEPASTETADDFLKAAGKKRIKIRDMGIKTNAYQYKDDWKKDFHSITQVSLPISALKSLLKEKYASCTVTEYLIAVYALSFLVLQKSARKKPVIITVAGDLRPFWGSGSLRNFSAGIPGLNVTPLHGCDFDDVLKLVCSGMKETYTKEKMEVIVNSIVRPLKLLNYVPFFIKKAIASAAFPFSKLVSPSTSVVSNLGYVKLPPSLSEHIESYSFTSGARGLDMIKCSAIGVKDILTVTYSSSGGATAIQDFCIDFFKRDGLPVTAVKG